MTKEQLEKLSKYEKELNYAVKLNFMNLGNGVFNEILKVYEELYNSTLTKSQYNCASCRLKALKKIGEDYFAAKEEAEKEAEKKKPGRPKKMEKLLQKIIGNDSKGEEERGGTTGK